MRESLALRFLYGTIPGRMVLKLLVQPKVSEAAGHVLSSGVSRFFVPYYISKHKIDMKGIDIPRKGFSSFNDFFTRKRRTGAFDAACGHVISPCDGWMSVVRLRENTVLNIKNTRFTLEDLLKDRELAGRFRGGTALVFRLTPADYHRYCYAADGKVFLRRKIRGVLHCVRPIALRTFPVFVQNSREYLALKTEELGTVVQMEIGALLVGKIKNLNMSSKGDRVHRGEEKGYFEFGGSTILLLFQKDAVCVREESCGRQNGDGEVKVRMGEWIAGTKEHALAFSTAKG